MSVLSFIAALALGSPSSAVPPSPYIDVGACPFECCVYRDWRAEGKVALFDHPDGRKMGELDQGEWVTALTGETHSMPLRIVASREVAEAGIHPATFFTYCITKGNPIGRYGSKAKFSTRNQVIPGFQRPLGGRE
jgi:hypothetical protein